MHFLVFYNPRTKEKAPKYLILKSSKLTCKLKKIKTFFLEKLYKVKKDNNIFALELKLKLKLINSSKIF